MTIQQHLRVDALGVETQFHVIDDSITATGRTGFEAMLTEMALGYTKSSAIGGWRGKEEQITVYRVASLTSAQVVRCVKFLLDARWSPAIGRIHRDVYVVENGMARGYCYEYDDAKIALPRWHGTRDTGWHRTAQEEEYYRTRYNDTEARFTKHRYATDWR